MLFYVELNMTDINLINVVKCIVSDIDAIKLKGQTS